MSDIILTIEGKPDIILSNEVNEVTLTNEVKTVEIAQKGLRGNKGADGADGADGEGVPTGGATGQVLAKVDGTDYNTEWVDDSNTLTWIDVAGDVEYTGVEAVIASGDVLECDYKGGTIYRFINSTNNANGYPIEDSFYLDFDGTNLTNLLVTRGV